VKIGQVEYENQERNSTAVIAQRINQFQLEPDKTRRFFYDTENKDTKEELDLL